MVIVWGHRRRLVGGGHVEGGKYGIRRSDLWTWGVARSCRPCMVKVTSAESPLARHLESAATDARVGSSSVDGPCRERQKGCLWGTVV